jgi:hypothetical protein
LKSGYFLILISHQNNKKKKARSKNWKIYAEMKKYDFSREKCVAKNWFFAFCL